MDQFIFYSVILQWIVLIVVILAIFLVFRQFGEVYLKESKAIQRDGLAIGETIPKFKAASVNSSKTYNHESILSKPTLITFISPNCKACKDMLPEWNDATTTLGNKINFILISTGRKEENERMLENNVIKSEVLIDEEMQIFRDFKARVTPFAFMINQKGEVTEKGLNNGKEHIHGLISSIEDYVELKGNDSNLRKGVVTNV
ncbi:TlpA family protein disulfide reductase [Cytobacillus firmus]|uniref:Thioredoxin domain-containing protein n=1 Tax=Cytobacillus firmus DS1 TaxID=1307436 RepID=W7L9Y0_CYTFI|nr:redoxin domain-containing protein [Cytobacillus firmus]EWG08609.1 hypothetical protein PBF_23208 [Cytobacillus firmus DS1]